MADVLRAYFDDAGLTEFSDYLRLMRAWKLIVGPVIGGRSMPASIAKGVLTILVRESVWANELSLLQGELKKRIRDALGMTVTEIRTRIGDIPEPPRENTAVHTPAAHPQEAPPWVDGIVNESGIADEELRRQFRRVIEAYSESARGAER